MKQITDQMRSIQGNSPSLMEFFNLRYGEIHLRYDQSTQMLGIIAIHSTRLGPALGGCRFLTYATIDDAMIDCMRLARTMSYKSAIHQLALGGGKAVLIKPTETFSRTSLLSSFGEFVHDLGGRFITAEDSGTSVADMDIIRTKTPYVTGNTSQRFLSKDPSPLTALGVRRSMQAAVKFLMHKHTLDGLHIAIQGLGHVGYQLAKELAAMNVRLTVSDINPESVKRCQLEFGAKNVAPDEIDTIACDIFAPCALGNAINAQNINKIRASIVAGSANNALENDDLAEQLKARNILYLPDYVINAGGLIHVAYQYFDKTEEDARAQIEKMYQVTLTILEEAQQKNLTPLEVANQQAEKILGI